MNSYPTGKGLNQYDLARFVINRPCRGYYVRWWYNGWHYWFFLPGQVNANTSGQSYRTIGTRKVTMSSGQITAGQCNAIRTIANTREISVLTNAGWKSVRVDDSSVMVYDHQINGYEIELMMTIGSRELSQNGFSPVNNIPGYVPDASLCETIIGSQIWMCKNYDAKIPGSKVYDDIESNRAVYGGLYSYAQINNPGFAPAGWHVPTEAEWEILVAYLGGLIGSGGILKETGLIHWNTPNTGALDSYGFKARGAGSYTIVYGYGYQRIYHSINILTSYWAISPQPYNYNYLLRYDGAQIFKMPEVNPTDENYASFYSVRLIKDTPAPPITDFDGNIYHSIIIGTQEWMVENLKTTHYNNGVLIPNLTINGDWAADIAGAYCYYNNNITNKAIFGNLYNWFAVNTGNLAPIGWRVPSLVDFQTLGAAIGGMATAATKLRKEGAIYWFIDDGTDNYGFAAVANGHRTDLGTWGGDGPPIDLDSGGLWTTTEFNATTSWYLQNNGGDAVLYEFMNDKPMGYAVRCMRDL